MTSNLFKEGTNNTVELQNTNGFLYTGELHLLYPNTLIDRWHIGSFTAAEYCISVEYNSSTREIIKSLVVGGLETTQISIYSRISTSIEMIDISAVYNSSYVDVIVNPTSAVLEKSKLMFFANYFSSKVPLSV